MAGTLIRIKPTNTFLMLALTSVSAEQVSSELIPLHLAIQLIKEY